MKKFAAGKMLAVLLAVLLTELALPAAAQEQKLVVAPAGSLALNENWQWALTEARNQSSWIVWQISSVLDEKVAPGNYYYSNHSFRGFSLHAMLAGNNHVQQTFSRRQELLIMILVDNGELARLDVTLPHTPQQWRHPVYWLGAVNSEESFNLLRAQLDSPQAENVANELLYAIGLHNHPDRAAFLDSLYAAAAWTDFKAAILASLALQQSSETEQLMLAVAADDQAGMEERKVAIQTLAGYDTAAALGLLRAMAEAQQPPALREQAIEALAYFTATQVEALLTSLAWFDTHFRIRAVAVESLAHVGTPTARAQLLELARDHPSGQTREAAIESLLNVLF